MKKILLNLIIILMAFVAPIKAIVVPKEKIDLNKNSLSKVNTSFI